MGDPLTEEDNDTLKTSQPPQTSAVEDTVTAGNGEEEEKVETDVSLGFTSEDTTGDATAATEEQPNPISGVFGHIVVRRTDSRMDSSAW
mmetsp:Transcript_41952/g.57228  ORF Transcript_41952/g.57228 Transcript_41952/m.57228 type:complete len:89 (+) Transcript_41952:550-816(+)